MINRTNFHHVREYIQHCQHVRQNSPDTTDRVRAHLRHLLEWADETPLPQIKTLDPFPAYLGEKKLAPATIVKTLTVARQFFTYCRMEYPHLFKPVTETWIQSLQPPRSLRPESRLPQREYYTYDDVLTISRLNVDTLHLQRAQMAVVMLFLSGMRADALASLPIHCVDLNRRAISQLPEFGVRTKNHKAAITYLLPIPELYPVLTRWQSALQDFEIQRSALWYATLSRDGDRITETETAFNARHSVIKRDIKKLCTEYGLKYLSPHKLRHGHVVYAVQRAKTMQQLKGISLNIMHKSVVTTDAVYNRLVGEDVREVIAGLV